MMSPEKQALLALEKEGVYVFHGSGADTMSLEPREAVDVKRGSEGPAGIYASDRTEYAIFMAIVSRENCPQGLRAAVRSSYAPDGSVTLRFEATEDTLDQICDGAVGYVYVFDKSKFEPRPSHAVEFVSHEPVEPIRKIKVTRTDLPEPVEDLTAK